MIIYGGTSHPKTCVHYILYKHWKYKCKSNLFLCRSIRACDCTVHLLDDTGKGTETSRAAVAISVPCLCLKYQRVPLPLDVLSEKKAVSSNWRPLFYTESGTEGLFAVKSVLLRLWCEIIWPQLWDRRSQLSHWLGASPPSPATQTDPVCQSGKEVPPGC